MRQNIALFAILAIFCAFLPGCASKYGERTTVVNYYPQCYQPIGDLRNREFDVAKGAAGGAALGAVGGALIGLLATGKWEGAATGAAIGAAAGGISGGVYASSRKDSEDTQRLAAYMQNLDGDISNLDVSAAAARTSLQCYDKQFTALIAAIRQRRITRDVAASRFAEICSGREEAINILGQLERYGRDLNQQYEQAFLREDQNLEAQRNTPAAARSYAQKKRTISAANTKRRELSRQTDKIAQEKAAAQTLTTQQTAEMNEAIAALNEIRV